VPSTKKIVISATAMLMLAAGLVGCTKEQTTPSPTRSEPAITATPFVPRPPVDSPVDRADLIKRVQSSMGQMKHFKSKRAGGLGDMTTRFDLTDPKSPRVESTTHDGYTVVQIGDEYFVKEVGAQAFAGPVEQPWLAEPFVSYPDEIAAFSAVEHLDSHDHDGKPSRHYLATDQRGQRIELWLDSEDRVYEYIIDAGTMLASNTKLYDYGVVNSIDDPKP